MASMRFWARVATGEDIRSLMHENQAQTLETTIETLDAIGATDLAGPEVLTAELDEVPLRDAARITAEAFDRIVKAAAG
jgi:hypothetical protein